MDHAQTDWLKKLLLGVALAGLVAGLGLHVSGRAEMAQSVWFAGVVPVLAALVIEILRSLARGEVGLDIVAALSMSAALTFGETLAASVVAVMYSGGTFLESFAEGRARREMRDLLSRVPRTATRHRSGGLEDVPLDAITPGDRLLIRQGDVVPVDGRIASATAFVDTSALTGESLPVRLQHGSEAMSGSTNAGDAFDLIATHEARDSTYAGIVRLVEAAQASKAPMARLADRWSLGFLAVTVAIALAAWWFTGDPIRAVAVLVVATPCPLILAVPVALVAGLSRAAHFGVLVKGAKPLEAMARIQTLILDKTGTLTDGRPQIVSIDSAGEMGADDILRFAAALDQASKHPVAQAVRDRNPRRGRDGCHRRAAGDRGRRRFRRGPGGPGGRQPPGSDGRVGHGGRGGRWPHGRLSGHVRPPARGRARDAGQPAAARDYAHPAGHRRPGRGGAAGDAGAGP